MMHNILHIRIKYIKCTKNKLYYNLSFEFDYRVEQKIENKDILRKRSLVNQKQHLDLEMSISKMAHTGREREHTCKITSRQSLSK
jgi:hypothetical protein